MALYVDIEKKCGDFLLKVKFTAEKEVLGLLGASGCGKSMTLKCIAGIEKPDKGVIQLDDKVFFDSEKRIHLPVQKRRVGYLFQDYALFPNMTVLQNILCGAGDRKKASEYVKRFFLEGKEQLYPAQLSGGQKQRLAIARVIAKNPKVYLFDDSFSALDYKTDAALRKALHEQAVSDIVVAHSWFRTLSGLEYASGFSAERILHEYEVALNTVILGEQAELTEPVREAITSILGIDASSLQVINRPPTRSKPIYMKVWEARKADGLDYDPDDERQQAFLSEITKYNIRSIE